MATRHTRGLANTAVAPSVLVLFLWMIVPLALTVYFSILNFNLLDSGSDSFAGLLTYKYLSEHFIGLLNYTYFLSDPGFLAALVNTLKLVGGVLPITVV